MNSYEVRFLFVLWFFFTIVIFVFPIVLRMYGRYIPNQKFDSIRISVLRDIKKNLKKITLIKDAKNIYFN